jgi:hypothetical protein
MRVSPLATRILLAIGATGFGGPAACGSNASVPPPDAAAESGITDASSDADGAPVLDGPAEAQDAAPEAGTDAVADAPPDAPACVRRPFLVAGTTRAGGLRARSDWGEADLDLDAATVLHPAARQALAAAWLEDGRQEHASIAAFARFTLMALSIGARPEHIAGAQRAALDEIAHARACFALARRYGGEDVGPGELSLDGALGALSLAELAVLTVHEGCVGETLGVELARQQLVGATDPLVVRALRRIVRDETRHAELAWSFVRWAIGAGDAALRADVARAFEAAARASRTMGLAGDPDARFSLDWRAHGRLTVAEVRSTVAAGLREVVDPCARALLGVSAPPERRATA